MLRKGLITSLLLLCPTLLAGCTSYYRVEVGGEVPDSVHSVFLIVADKDPVETFKVKDMVELIRPERIGKYLMFAQFDPDKGRPLRWKQQSLQGESEQILVSLSEDQSVVVLKVDKALLEAYRDLTVVAVGHGNDGWYGEVVDAGKLRLESGVRFDIGSSRFVRRLLK